jgi:hypothetical protein
LEKHGRWLPGTKKTVLEKKHRKNGLPAGTGTDTGIGGLTRNNFQPGNQVTV